MRQTQRPRKPASRALLAVGRPFLRYSYSRDAYVLRLIGNSRGPVLVPRAVDPHAGQPDAGEPPASSDSSPA